MLHAVHVVFLATDFGNLGRTLNHHVLRHHIARKQHSKKEKEEEKQFISHYLANFQYYSHSMVAGGFDEMS